MSDIYIPLKESKCDYRHCNNKIPKDSRSDSKYCCPNHGAKERYLLKKDNKIKTSIQKGIDKSYIVVKDLYNRGKTCFPKLVLDYSEFDFNAMTGITDIDNKSGIVIYNIFEYELTVIGNQCKIKKLQLC